MWLDYNIGENGFKLYPELNAIPEFKALKKKFGEQKASDYIICIAKTEDPDSKLYNRNLESRRQLVETQWIKEEVPWEDEIFKEAITAYSREGLPFVAKFLKTWSDKIHEAERWVNEQQVETILSNGKYVNNLSNLMEKYTEHKDKYDEEKEKSAQTMGGVKLSRRQRRKREKED